jgi:16S rRNA (uracil1498-N3)-methyltransferase
MVLRGGDAHHLTVVRRARPGDGVRVSDGAGVVVDGRVASVSRGTVEVERVAERRVPRPAPRVRVLQGLAKGARVDAVVQHLVELGADDVVVFTSGRSVPRWDAPKRAQMGARWAAIGREAAKQSRRPWLPRVSGPVGAAEAAGLLAGDAALLADEAGVIPLRDVLEDIDADAGRSVIIGPEGGLTPVEHAAFRAAGAVPFSLGPQILRTETAALAAATLVLHHAGRLG